jgi:hypothetical protein
MNIMPVDLKMTHGMHWFTKGKRISVTAITLYNINNNRVFIIKFGGE